MANKPDFKIKVAQKSAAGVFYKEVGVAWKGETKDGREKIDLRLYMFPDLKLCCYLNEKPDVSDTSDALESTGETDVF